MHFLHLPPRGCSCPSCTNRAKFSHSRFCEFSVFCGRTLRCLVGALETRAPPWRAAWVWQDAIPSYENSHRLHRCAQIRSKNAA